ncbi:MAG: GntR family transcriptional regulator [Microbacterium sp.]
MTDLHVSLKERLGPAALEGKAFADQIFAIIGHAIVEGTLVPGEKVNDKELAAALGISRTPVREALLRLAWVGLIETVPSRYTRVTEVSAETVRSTFEHVGMQASVALQLAMRRMDADESAEALRLVDRVIDASASSDSEAMMQESVALLEYLVSKSGNPIFQATMAETSLLVARNLKHLRAQPDASDLRVECYRKMREAMVQGDADAAEKWFRAQHGVGVDTAL